MTQAYDFQGLNSQLLTSAEAHVAAWLPAGKRRGHEWVVGSLSGEQGSSLSINLNTGKWSDFATGEVGGDLISLYAAVHRLGMGDAYRELGGAVPRARVNGHAAKPAEPERRVVMPVPEAAAICECVHPKFGRPVATWCYQDGNGEVLGYVARYEPAGERKQIVPWTWDGDRWGMGQWPAPRPLYGLDHLAERGEAPVLVVEGEKAAAAARRFCKPYVVVTWPGGAKALSRADWAPIHGRKVLLWPDADEPGIAAMDELGQLLQPHCPEIKVIDVAGMPAGWDAADAEFEAWSECRVWMAPRAQLWRPPMVEDNGPEPPPYVSHEDATWPSFSGPPIDVFSEAPVPDIERDMLPDAIARYSFDQAALMGVTPGMIALPSIVACAAAIHDGIELQPKRFETGWRESARLWCAVVGSPSVRKSPSLRRAIARLRKINREMCEANDQKQAKYQAQVEEWKEAKRSAKRAEEPVPEAPEEPVKERMIVEDVTIEALSEILKHNPRGVLCVQDELTGWFGSMDAYNGGKGANKDRAHWLEIYNGGHHMVDRVMRGSVHIPNWSACMVGGIQPDMIRKVAKTMGEDGLMQRFMIIMGRNAGAEQDRPEDEVAKRAYSELIDHLHAIQPGHEPVKLSEDAHLVRERLYDYAREMGEYRAMPNGLKSHLGKWAGLFARLLLTYHVIDCAGRRVHPSTQTVSGKTAEQVELLMRRYLLPHAMAYYTDVLGEESHLEHVRWIAGFILTKGCDRLENRDVVQGYKQWRGVDEWMRVRVMATLEELGWIQPAAPAASGRKMPTVWAVNPEAHQAFLGHAENERQKRAKLRERLVEIGRVVDVVQKEEASVA